MHLRKTLFESGDEIEKIFERQVRMQASHDVELGHRLAVAGGRCLPGLLERHRISARSIFLAAKGAEPASGNANVRWIDMPVDVEVRNVAMHPLAHQVGQPANRQNVSGAIEVDAVVEAETLFRHHFFSDRQQPRIVGLKAMALRAKLGQAHPPKNKPNGRPGRGRSAGSCHRVEPGSASAFSITIASTAPS